MTKENELVLSCISGNPFHYSTVSPLETKLGLCSHNPQISIDLHMAKESQNRHMKLVRNSKKFKPKNNSLRNRNKKQKSKCLEGYLFNLLLNCPILQ